MINEDNCLHSYCSRLLYFNNTSLGAWSVSAHKNVRNTFKINVSYDFSAWNISTDHDKNKKL